MSLSMHRETSTSWTTSTVGSDSWISPRPPLLLRPPVYQFPVPQGPHRPALRSPQPALGGRRPVRRPGLPHNQQWFGQRRDWLHISCKQFHNPPHRGDHGQWPGLRCHAGWCRRVPVTRYPHTLERHPACNCGHRHVPAYDQRRVASRQFRLVAHCNAGKRLRQFNSDI